jgi:potassium-dependent mechanosensitive channel
MREHLFAAGETLVRQGDEGNSFFIIHNGGVIVCVEGAKGERTEVAHLEKDDFFGEMSLLTGEKRTATITAATDTSVLVLSKESLAEMMVQNDHLAEQLAKVLAHRSQDSQAKLATSRDANAAKLSKTSETTLLHQIRAFFGLPQKA